MIKQSWDSVWEDVFSNQEWGKYPSESLIQFIARNYYKLERGSVKVLEVGCGPGANIWYLSREKFNVFGIDGSKTAIESAIKRLKSENLNATFVIGDILNLPYEDNYFNCVLDNECIYANNRQNSKLMLSEINRVLKQGGLFYSRTFSDDMYIGKAFHSIEPFEYNDISDGPLSGKGFVRLINKEEILNLYGEFFKIVSIDKLEFTSHNGTIKTSEWIIICEKE